MAKEKGNLSINSENFLPIIKKWLYTDKDIFIRELVSNACDAVNKFKKLVSMGEATATDNEKYEVNIYYNADKKTLKFCDNGIGMSDEEIKKYITQIAFSGATDFLSQFKDKISEENDIIGHFGLGFYSAFMVSEKVEIDSLSYREGAKPAKWICEGGIDYEMDEGERTERGTTITLYLNDDDKEFVDEGVLYSALRKYCAFMPVEIYIEDENAENEENIEDETSDVIDVEADGNNENESENERVPLNNPTPLWLADPKDCTDEQYIEFYKDVFNEVKEPLFWIHLNMDYPFRLKGILYFPRLANDLEVIQGQIKLFSNQVFIADNVKEVVPEFLLLLKGIIDCPDIPLNVSRSALQNDGYAKKMSSYITKKVADKLNKLFKDDRTEFEKFFDDISLFVKYGCIREQKFFDKIKDSVLFNTTDDDKKTMKEYLEKNSTLNEIEGLNGSIVYYVSNKEQQVQYINLFKEQGMEALMLTAPIDISFMSFIEQQGGIRFRSIDSNLADALRKDSKSDEEKNIDEGILSNLKTVFNTFSEKVYDIKLEELKTESVSSMITLDEESRRICDIIKTYKQQPNVIAAFKDIPIKETLVLNKNNSLVKKLLEIQADSEKADDTKLVCRHLLDLALLGYKQLTPAEMSEFIQRSNTILEKLIK